MWNQSILVFKGKILCFCTLQSGLKCEKIYMFAKIIMKVFKKQFKCHHGTHFITTTIDYNHTVGGTILITLYSYSLISTAISGVGS